MHCIRLRGPWKKHQGANPQIRVTVPEDPAHFSPVAAEPLESPTVYTRSFNQPSGLDSETTVHLSISHWRGELEKISLNQTDLTPQAPMTPPLRIDLSQSLASYNCLELSISALSCEAAALDGEVQLEITPPQTQSKS